MKINIKFLALVALIITITFACDEDDPEPVSKSSEKQLLTFKFLSSNNQFLEQDIVASIDEDSKAITAKMPLGTDLTALTPTIEILRKL